MIFVSGTYKTIRKGLTSYRIFSEATTSETLISEVPVIIYGAMFGASDAASSLDFYDSNSVGTVLDSMRFGSLAHKFQLFCEPIVFKKGLTCKKSAAGARPWLFFRKA